MIPLQHERYSLHTTKIRENNILSNPVVVFRAAEATAVRVSGFCTAKPTGQARSIHNPASRDGGLIISEKVSRTVKAVLTILILFCLVHATPSTGMTLTVVALSAGFQQDPVTGLLSIEVEHFDSNTSQGGHNWTVESPGGASSSGAARATPNSGSNNNTGYESLSPRLDYRVNFTQAGTHYVWVRGIGSTLSDDSLHVGLNGVGQSGSDRVTGFTTAWTWSDETMDGVRATVEVSEPGEQLLNIWMREDGVLIDKIVLTTDASLQPSSFGVTGPPESSRGPVLPSLQFTTGTVDVTADEGDTAAQVQTVSLDTSDGQAAGYTLAAASSGWLSVTPLSGGTPAATVTVTADPSGLAAGQYTGTITATSSGYLDAVIEVTLTVVADLFVVEEFSDGDLSAWTLVEASGDPTDWRVVDGKLNQLSRAARIAGPDSYFIGTYAFLTSQTNLRDFEFSVEIMPQAPAPFRMGDDVGVMFRYSDDDNYYRLSINSKMGQTRLERRIGGQFSTIAVTPQGYFASQTVRVGVRMQGPAMLIYRDNGESPSVFDSQPYLAGYDLTLASGSIALYTQSEASFDNVVLKSLGSAPYVGLVSPTPFHVDSGSSIETEAVTINAAPSAHVDFQLDGVPCDATSNARPALFQSTCEALVSGEHSVEAILSDPSVVARDEAVAVATEGLYVATVGDSISNGTGDLFVADNVGADIEVGGVPVGPRQVSFRGYQTVVHDRLTSDPLFGKSNVLFNEAIGGDRTDELVYGRLPSILERHPKLSAAYVMIGTNDANQNSPMASGLGCSGISCDNTYKGMLLDLVDTLETSNVEPIFAKIPPIFGQRGVAYDAPLDASTRNAAVIAFNSVVEEVTRERNLRPGPDFFAEFLTSGENRFSLFEDFLHPNSLGYVWMANAWKQVLAPDDTAPFILRNLCVRRTSSDCVTPFPYKQNIREAGNTYYTDRTYVLQSLPEQLEGGIWIVAANDDKTNARTDYLEFTVDRDVDVYVAFTPSATFLPDWMASFDSIGSTLSVSAVPSTLELYSKFFAAGSLVTLGGNVAPGIVGGGDNNYVVIVVPR